MNRHWTLAVTGCVLCCAVIGQTGTGLRPGAGAAGAAGGEQTPAGAQSTPGGAQQPAEPQPGSEDQAGPGQAAAQLGGAAAHSCKDSRRKKHFDNQHTSNFLQCSVHPNVTGTILYLMTLIQPNNINDCFTF